MLSCFEPVPDNTIDKTIPKAAVIAILWAWLALLSLTHLGGKSPYAYGWAVVGSPEPPARMMGAVVNPDALPLRGVAMFFYDAAPMKWAEAQNLRFPSHAFATSIVAGLTRSYLFAGYFVNYLFAALVAWAAVS